MKSVKKKYISETYLRDVEEYDYKLVENKDNNCYISIKKIKSIKLPFCTKNSGCLIDNMYSIIEVVPLDENYCIRLFIDDNKLNLEEAKFFCPDIMTMLPDKIGELYAAVSMLDKNDEKLSRLESYKVLEKKNKIKSPSPEIQGWVLDFFRFATISVRFSLFSRKLYAIFFIFFAKSVPF